MELDTPIIMEALPSAIKLGSLGNLMYENADNNERRIEWALYLWKLAMEKASHNVYYLNCSLLKCTALG